MYYSAMNVTIDDPAVKRTVILNLCVEMLVMVVAVKLTYDQIHHDDFDATVNGDIQKAKIKAALKAWRNKLFGPPRPSEEQINNWARLVHIEAARIIREADVQ